MLPKILLLFINLFAFKAVFSQTVYSASPTFAYSANAVPSSQGYTLNSSPSATVTTSPPSYVSTSSSRPSAPIASSTPCSPSTEAKAYFLPGPIPDPKVTILSDRQSLVEIKQKLSAEPNIIDLNPRADPGFIEVMGKFCDPKNVKLQREVSMSLLPMVKENSVPPVKRLSMACTDNDPFVSADSSRYQLLEPFCPGI